ncbi:MAG: hypothetical protein E7263_02000 [Lachnospiraceae bacterium]|nr:hypothetical protein [Lachnospiraceae bacterium]
MKIGICGNANKIKSALHKLSLSELVSAKICNYIPEELLLDIEEGFFDCEIMFMDIALTEFGVRDVTGIDLAKKINQCCPRCQIVYISDGNEYIDDIYDTKHVYLMSRENIDDKMQKAWERAMRTLTSVMDKDVIEIRSSGCRNYLHRDQILYIERDGRRILVVTPNNKYYCYESIKEIKNKLDERMIQIHGGGIVNLGYITYLGKGIAELSCQGIEKVFPVGRTFLKTAREAYYNYWKKDSG